MSHVHVHAPHELTEKEERGGQTTRSERVLELAAVLLLSITTLATAWSGYQAARWSGEQSQNYAKASTLRIKSQRASTAAGQFRIADLILFNNWLNAHDAGDKRLEAEYRRRFRPEFVPAYRAWLAQHPFTNRKSAPGPLYVPQYRLAADAHAREADAKADDLFTEGTDAKSNDDKYILSTVFFAAVLFSAGISLRLEWRPLRIAVLCLGGAMLLGGAVFVLTLPVA
jgi:hypothetical protein